MNVDRDHRPRDGGGPSWPKGRCATGPFTWSPHLAAGAAEADEQDRFVAGNYALLKQAGLVEAGVPAELGGGGAAVRDLAEMLRILARGCSSTALAFSMHTHQVAIPAWRWRHQKLAAMEPLLKRIAAERIIILSSGGSDWIAGSGKAERVEGGYRITARKVFSSGAPVGDLMMTGAVLHEDGADFVLHFGVTMKAPEVECSTPGGRSACAAPARTTCSIEGLFIPDAAVALKRPAGAVASALPHHRHHRLPAGLRRLSRRRRAGARHRGRRSRSAAPRRRTCCRLAGRMDTALRAARLAHDWMLAATDRNAPSAETINDVMTGRRW